MLAPDKQKLRRRPVASSVGGPSTSGGSTLFNRRDGAAALSLHDKDFVLDIEDNRLLRQLSTEIEKLGGRIVTEVSEDKKPFCLVSDCEHMTKVEKMKPEHISPQLLKCLPMLVRDAVRLRVRCRSCKVFFDSLAKLKLRIKNERKVMNAPTKKASHSHHQGMLSLHAPYIKLEDNRGAFAPLYKQFTVQSNCHKVYLGKSMGKSLFHKNHHPETPLKAEKSPNEKAKVVNAPRNGFCEICCKKFENNKEHFGSREHLLSISQPGLWSSVDELCGSFVDYVSSANQRVRLRARHSPPSPSAAAAYR